MASHDAGELAAPERVPRFVRVNTLHDANRSSRLDDAAAVAAALGLPPPLSASTTAAASAALDASCVRPVAWLPRTYGVYSLPPGLPLASTPAVREGRLAGVDAASLAAVAALDAQPGHDVLDLCAAPGAKLAAVAQAMGQVGDLVGADVSLRRLGTACTLSRRYRLVSPGEAWPPCWRYRLYHCDGTAWADAVGAPPAGAPAALPPSAPPAPTLVLPVLDSLVESMFRKPHHATLRGLPPPFVLRPPAVAGVAQRWGRGGGGRGSGVPLLEWLNSRYCRSEARKARAAQAAAVSDGTAAPPTKRPRTDGADGEGSSSSASSSGDAPLSPAAEVLTSSLTAPPPAQYHRVLVDAQCTHDASARHVAKARRRAADARAAATGAASGSDDEADEFEAAGDDGGAEAAAHTSSSSASSAPLPGDGADGAPLAPASGVATTSLRDTQRGLLLAGYRCLRPGGLLVYATCSGEAAQNEDIVAWLLRTQPDAALVPLPTLFDDYSASSTAHDAPPPPQPPLPPAGHTPAAEAAWWQATHATLTRPPWTLGSDGCTARFEPRRSGTSGLFLARLTKRAADVPSLAGAAAVDERLDGASAAAT